MAKSLVYVPGLAMREIVVRQARDWGAFSAKVADAFGTTSFSGSTRRDEADLYMEGTLDILKGKGAQPADCQLALQWLQVSSCVPVVKRDKQSAAADEPRAKHAPNAKAFKILGTPAANVLADQPGKFAAPLKVRPNGMELAPCDASEYLAQPAGSTTQTKTLTGLEDGDTLYIVGHSNASGGTLTYKMPADPTHEGGVDGCQSHSHSIRCHVDPVTLGSLLINEGLPNAKLDIVIVSCFSGGVDPPQLQTVQSYSQRLAGTLGARGYASMRVFGAPGLTRPGENGEMEVLKNVRKDDDGKLSVNTRATAKLGVDSEGPSSYEKFFRFHSTAE